MDTPVVLYLFGGALFLILGLLHLVAPEEVWEAKHRHAVRGGEPTRFFIVTTRIFGGVLLICAVACAVLAITGWHY